MDVVLRHDVDKLGLRGDVVSVARGYARNYLLPRGLAELATPGLLRELERRESQRARQEAKTADEARAIAARLEAAELRFDANAGPTGSLFGSVTATNVADRLWEDLRVRVDRRKLHFETIKRVGRYTVPVELFAEVTAELRLVVAPEGVEPPTEEELAAAAAAEVEAATAEEPEPEAAVAEAPEPEAVALAEAEAEPATTPEVDEPAEAEPSAEEPADEAAEAELSAEPPAAAPDELAEPAGVDDDDDA
jgi:large subunit ribosomal protein L9